jgi:hypothetical protein
MLTSTVSRLPLRSIFILKINRTKIGWALIYCLVYRYTGIDLRLSLMVLVEKLVIDDVRYQ